MKRLKGVAYLMLASVLAGCSGVPDCADEKTTALTKELVLQSLLGNDAKALSDMFKVEIGAVQTVSHEKDPEKFSCKAEVKITTTGKLAELFGNAGDEIVRMLEGKMADSEVGKLEKYSALSKYLGKVAYGVDTEVTSDIMLQVAASASGLNEPRQVEFISTTAKQDGADRHLVEIKPIWEQPIRPVIELAKFSKAYTPNAAKSGQTSLPASAVAHGEQQVSDASAPQISASFDCAKATSNVEKLICSNAELAASDVELSRIYEDARTRYPDQAEQMRTEQMRWRTDIRDKCEDAGCIQSAYSSRISEFNWTR